MPELDATACVVCRSCRTGPRYPVSDESVCGSCLAELPCCDGCHDHALRVTETADDRRLCSACARAWGGCVSCARLTEPHERTDTDRVVCYPCASAFFDRCFHCGRHSAASRYVSGGLRACTRCAGGFTACERCGTLRRGGRECELCSYPARVRNYSFKPDPRFHGDGPLYLGLELEIVVPDHVHDTAVGVVTDRLGGLGYVKRDSSIEPGGFELVSHPMSYRYALDEFPWGLLGELAELGCGTNAGVGLHVHASRAGFVSPAHVYRWMKLLYRNESQVTRLARRRSRYAPFDRVARSRVKDTAKNHVAALGLDRYQAINPYPRHTLELRVFSSSLDVGRVQAALAFTAASIDYTRTLRIADVRAGAWEWDRFAAWVHTRPAYSPLVAQLRELELTCAC
ncbi:MULTISPECIES: amidoligase family protein [Nocardia]|uniref:amidoligase family protein n=1 Tax=Nocardia TaxID=1817 RepID=UPI001E4A99B6|nr:MULTISPECIES: amidoligase family protein [Nocardia]